MYNYMFLMIEAVVRPMLSAATHQRTIFVLFPTSPHVSPAPEIYPVKRRSEQGERDHVKDEPVFREPCPEGNASQAKTGQDYVHVSEDDG
jgi:hypothetical protein